MRLRAVLIDVVAAVLTVAGLAQAPAKLEFDVASIKRNLGDGAVGGIRRLRDGTYMIRGEPILVVLGNAVGEPILTTNYVGLPRWADSEQYDITVRPPAGSSSAQIRQMWQTLLEQRMKYAAHVEHRESTTFALVMARTDRRLGRMMKKSTIDCGAPKSEPLPPPTGPADMLQRCGMMSNATSMVSGAITMDVLARNLQGRAGGVVENHTGLDGAYSLQLTFAPPPGATDLPPDAPDFFTALEDELGLKLQKEKGTVPYLVIDHIERPTEN